MLNKHSYNFSSSELITECRDVQTSYLGDIDYHVPLTLDNSVLT
jgi:hypothetical protein